MITSHHTYWVYRDGVPVKRLSTHIAANEFAADLRVRYPGSVIQGKYAEYREEILFTMEPLQQYVIKETHDA